jgi:hypothetical protein
LAFFFRRLRCLADCARLDLRISNLNPLKSLAVVVRSQQGVKGAFHRIPYELDLATDQLFHLKLDVLFLLSVVSDEELMDVFAEFLLLDVL